jgi:hypothetical protein
MLNVHFPPECASALAKDYSLAHINSGTHSRRAGALSSARCCGRLDVTSEPVM